MSLPNAAWASRFKDRLPVSTARVGMDRRTGKILTGWDHVQQSMEVILTTRYDEMALRRWVGSWTPYMLGQQNITPSPILFLFWSIATAFDLYEPCYDLQRVRFKAREDGTSLTSVEEVRSGHISLIEEGIYMPRGHLGDKTPWGRQSAAMIGQGNGRFRVLTQ